MNTRRAATENDSKEVCHLIRRSIIEICGPDYDNDKQILDEWLSNKTTINIDTWIRSKSSASLVITNNVNEILGFSLFSESGEILLLYVLPEHQKCGVGSALLEGIEKEANNNKITTITAYSTISAKLFYEKHNFTHFDKPNQVGHIVGEFPMQKSLGNSNRTMD